MKLNIIGGAYALDNAEIDQQTCINWYAQSAESGGGQNALIPTAGLVKKYQIDTACIASKMLSSGVILLVGTNALYRLQNATVTKLGDIATTQNATIADNGKVAVIATGAKLYQVDLKTWVVSEITADGFNGCQYVDFLDGYFVFGVPNTGQYAWLKLYSTAYDALNFATAEGSPDNVVWLGVVGREMWAIGSQSTEVFYNTGDQNLPFRRVGGAFMTVGCDAPKTVAKLGGSLVFIGKTDAGGRQVVLTQGYQPQRISTHAIERVLQNANMAQAQAFSYQQNGHGFYVLNLPDLDKTFVYDALTNLWHERAWQDADNKLHRWRGQCHVYDGVDNLIADHTNGKIYALRHDLFTDDGQPIYRERTLPFFPSEKKNVSYLRFELECSVNAADTDGQMNLSWSDDYAKTFHPAQTVSLGKTTDELKRVVWRRLGIGRQRTFRLSTTTNSRCALVNAYIEVQGADR